MQVRSQSLLWSKPLHLPHQLHGPQGPGRPDCCPHCPLLLPNPIICSILDTTTIQLSQNAYFSHHDLCTWCSFCLECFSLRSLISWKFLLNSQPSLPFSKIIPCPPSRWPPLLFIVSPYSPSLQDAFYYPAFCCRCIHAFIFHLLQGNVSSMRAWIWLVKRSADLGEFQDLESHFNHREMHKYLFN